MRSKKMRQQRYCMICTVLMVVLFPLVLHSVEQEKSLEELIQDATQAHREKDYPAYLTLMRKVHELKPGNPYINYYLACSEALMGNKRTAITILEALVRQGMYFPITEDDDLLSLHSENRFRSLAQMFQENNRAFGASSVQFTLPAEKYLIESVTYDPVEGFFYLSSIYQRKIIRIDQSGKYQDFLFGKEFNSFIDIAVDPYRHVLWALNMRTGFMDIEGDENNGVVTIYEVDLTEQGVLGSYSLPGADENVYIDSCCVTSNGTVYITSSQSRIYRIVPDQKKIDVFVTMPMCRSLQGITPNDDCSKLFVSDYRRGFYSIDIASKKITPVSHHQDIVSLGTDGLSFYQNSLIAIQNGVSPFRVVRFFLDTKQQRIIRARVLEQNNGVFGEPTYGVVKEDDFFYVANSQWEYFRNKEDGAVTRPVIMKLPL